MIRDEIQNLIKKAIMEEFGKIKIPKIEVTRPEVKEHGDYSSNVAMKLAGLIKKKPIEIAEAIKLKVKNQKLKVLEKIEAINPGFINFYLSKDYLQKQIGEILEKGEKFGPPKFPKRKPGRVNVEFISGNPTGPLTLGNGRGGFLGDVLANILAKAGFEVEREYYINDVGEQIRKLGRGEYDKLKEVKDIRKKIKEKDPQKSGDMAAKIILEEKIKPFIKEELKIKFDVWFSEKKLYKSREVDKVLTFLKEKNLAYEKDNALWFKSSQFGDAKDRVLVKADGEKTYLASDIAYLKNKFERGFDKLIYVWGADHHGYVKRIEAAAEALGYKKEQLDFIIMQLVRLIEKGKEVRMSKRTGAFVALEELINEVGLDVARFFFLMHSTNSHMNFDLALAKERSQKNPVYYVQYAFARLSSILRKSDPNTRIHPNDPNIFSLLSHSSELELIRQLIRLPEVVEDTAKDYQVQRLPNYAMEMVTAFHKFYEECRVISDDKALTQARLSLVMATKIVLKNILDIMGISAPEKM